MRILGFRHFTTNLSREECERRIWLLVGTNMPTPQPKKRYTSLVFATVYADGFVIWIGATSYPSELVTGSTLALHGRLLSTADGTNVETWYRLQRWLLRWIGVLSGLAGVWAQLQLMWPEALTFLFGAYAWWALNAIFLVLVFWFPAVVYQLHDDRLGQLLSKSLRERTSSDENSEDSQARTARRRRRRARGRSMWRIRTTVRMKLASACRPADRSTGSPFQVPD